MDSLLKIGEPGPSIASDGTVLTRDPTDGSWEDDASADILDLCGICEKQGHRYTCPRCKIKYCSLSCYKGERHAECSEGFYKEEFLDAMKHKVSDPTERQEMASILKNFEEQQLEEQENTDELETALAERIKGLDLDDEGDAVAIWNRLTAKEQADFNNKRKLAALLVQWTPWWEHNDNNNLIHEVNDSDEDEALGGSGSGSGFGDDMLARREPAAKPPLETGITPLSQILRGKAPAKELIYNALDLMYTYVYMCLRYNGDIDQVFTEQECTEAILTISGVLGSNSSYTSTTQAVQSVLQNIAQQPEVFVSPQYSAQVLTDLLHVLSSCTNVGVALSHLLRIVKRAAANKAPTLMPEAKTTRKRIKLASKKLEFYLSWWSWLVETKHDQDQNVGDVLFSVLREETKREQIMIQRDLEEVDQGKRALEKTWNGKRPPPKNPLIQEL